MICCDDDQPCNLIVIRNTTRLSTSDHIILLRQNIHQLSFAFVTPLCAQHDADLCGKLFRGSRCLADKSAALHPPGSCD